LQAHENTLQVQNRPLEVFSPLFWVIDFLDPSCTFFSGLILLGNDFT